MRSNLTMLVTDLAPYLYLSELRRDFLASVGITYAVFRIAKSLWRVLLKA